MHSVRPRRQQVVRARQHCQQAAQSSQRKHQEVHQHDHQEAHQVNERDQVVRELVMQEWQQQERHQVADHNEVEQQGAPSLVGRPEKAALPQWKQVQRPKMEASTATMTMSPHARPPQSAEAPQ